MGLTTYYETKLFPAINKYEKMKEIKPLKIERKLYLNFKKKRN